MMPTHKVRLGFSIPQNLKHAPPIEHPYRHSESALQSRKQEARPTKSDTN